MNDFWEKLGNWFHGDGFNTDEDIRNDPFHKNWFSGMGEELGAGWNNLTGTSASQDYQSAEAQAQRNWETSEREAAQDYNSAEAQKARDFQLEMDNTAVSRRMQDLQNAGINPMAMVSGGSFLSGGSTGTTAASSSPGHGASASGAGNSAAAVGGLIRALSGLVSTVIKVRSGD